MITFFCRFNPNSANLYPSVSVGFTPTFLSLAPTNQVEENTIDEQHLKEKERGEGQFRI